MSELYAAITAKLLGLMAVVSATALLTWWAKIPDQMDAGDQLQRFADQAKLFMVAQFQTAGGCVGPGGLVAETAAGVREYSYDCLGLDASWRNTNVYGQSHVLKVFQPTPGATPPVLYGLAQTCGGDTLDDTTAAKAAARAQPDGGVLLTSNPGQYVSTGGKWAIPSAPFNTSACPAEPGRLAAFIILDGGQAVPPFLYRFAVAGTTEPNTMHTDLRGDGVHDVTGFRDVAASRNVSAGENITAGGNVGAGGVVSGGAGVRSDLVVAEGDSCGSAGMFGRTVNGAPLVCVAGRFELVRYGRLSPYLASGGTSIYTAIAGDKYQTQTLQFYLPKSGTAFVSSNIIASWSMRGYTVLSSQINIDGTWCGTSRYVDTDGSAFSRANSMCVMHLGPGWHYIYSDSGNIVYGGTPQLLPLYSYTLEYSVIADEM